ncbi:MAG TPA: hypothetical protein VN687_03125 [Blastocatellia bacterium]|nr:hypothetical protein [Blastocatellia bacterium]
MHRIRTASLILPLMFLSAASASQNPYTQPLKPKGFSANAIALPPRTIGKTVIRAKHSLAVEIRVEVEDYLPRNMEPTLMIDGVAIVGPSGVAGVEGNITTLFFVVEKPELVKDKAVLTIQMGDDERTRAAVPGTLQRDKIKPLSLNETKRLELPALTEWFRQR